MGILLWKIVTEVAPAEETIIEEEEEYEGIGTCYPPPADILFISPSFRKIIYSSCCCWIASTTGEF